jgi:transposase
VLNLPPSVQIYVAIEPADMRKSFDGLSALVEGILKKDPMSGHLFVFRNRKGDRLKILYWDRSGFCIWYKLLEKGTFRFPAAKSSHVEMSATELALILEGIDLKDARWQPRFAWPRKSVASEISAIAK